MQGEDRVRAARLRVHVGGRGRAVEGRGVHEVVDLLLVRWIHQHHVGAVHVGLAVASGGVVAGSWWGHAQVRSADDGSSEPSKSTTRA